MIKTNPVSIRNEHEEYRQVRHDLVIVICLNAALFALLIGLYFLNQSTGLIDSFFANLLKF